MGAASGFQQAVAVGSEASLPAVPPAERAAYSSMTGRKAFALALGRGGREGFRARPSWRSEKEPGRQAAQAEVSLGAMAVLNDKAGTFRLRRPEK